MNALVLVVDGLHAGFLGFLGNAWVATPALDRLAAVGTVFDQALCESPDLEAAYQGYWTGRSALGPHAPPAAPLAALLGQSGVNSIAVTDEAWIAELAAGRGFAEVVRVPTDETASPAGAWDETQLARVLAEAAGALDQARPPFLVWVHARGPTGPWDAPLELRRQYRDPDAPEFPPQFVPPQRLLPAQADPDLRTALRWDYAAQVAVLDRCLDALWQQLEEGGQAPSTLVLLTSPRGYPLGEHRRVGIHRHGAPGEPGVLHEELVHLPLALDLPQDGCGGGRSHALVQPPDVAATLLDAFGLPGLRDGACGHSLLPAARDEAGASRQAACLIAEGGERAIRTAAWYLRWREAPSGAALDARPSPDLELYVKPDDRWEANDVADRVPQVIAPLRGAFAGQRSWLAGETLQPPAPLADALVTFAV